MKILSLKNIILTVLQVPVLLAQCINAYIELLLTRCLVCLANPLSTPFDYKQAPAATSEYNIDTPGPSGEYDTDTVRILYILEALGSRKNNFIIKLREAFERTEAGLRTVKTHPDRRLYAVLRPTRQENLRRIKNALDNMEPAEISRILEAAKELSRGV